MDESDIKQNIVGGIAMNKANNQRTQETNRHIIEAVYRLMQEGRKPLSRITIAEVCARAGIHRSTFYAHYQDIFDVVEQVEATMSKRLAESFLEQLEQGADARACFVSLFGFIAENREFYKLYLNETHKAGVIGVATEMFQERMEKANFWERGEGEDEQRYALAFFLYGITAMIRRWLDRDCAPSPEAMYEIMLRQIDVQRKMIAW